MLETVGRLIAFLHVEAEFAEASWRVCYNFTPVIEPVATRPGLAEAFLDLTGCRGGWGLLGKISRALSDSGLGTARLGAAANKLVARTAFLAQRPGGSHWMVVPSGKEREFLEPLSIEYLWPLPAQTLAELVRLGLNRISDVLQVDPQALTAQLGPLGLQVAAWADGRDHEPVAALWPGKVFHREKALEAPIDGVDELRRLFRGLAEELGAELRSYVVGGGQVVTTIELGVDGGEASLGLKHATDDLDTICAAAWRLWETMGRPAPATKVEFRWQTRTGVALASPMTPSVTSTAGRLSAERQACLKQALGEIRRRFGGDSAIYQAGQLPLTWRERALECFLGYGTRFKCSN